MSCVSNQASPPPRADVETCFFSLANSSKVAATDAMVWTLIEPGVAIVAASLATNPPPPARTARQGVPFYDQQQERLWPQWWAVSHDAKWYTQGRGDAGVWYERRHPRRYRSRTRNRALRYGEERPQQGELGVRHYDDDDGHSAGIRRSARHNHESVPNIRAPRCLPGKPRIRQRPSGHQPLHQEYCIHHRRRQGQGGKRSNSSLGGIYSAQSQVSSSQQRQNDEDEDLDGLEAHSQHSGKVGLGTQSWDNGRKSSKV